MSFKNIVYNAEPCMNHICDGVDECHIIVNGKRYTGISRCAPSDMEFYSEKVGATIAHMRAMIAAFDAEIAKTDMTAKILFNGYKDVVNNYVFLDQETVSRFASRVDAAYTLLKRYKMLRQDMKNKLNKYLEAQDRAIYILTKNRKIKDENK